jgi:probable rRNA maturation factor
MIQVAIANEQDLLPLDEARLRDAVAAVLAEEGPPAATVSVAVVDDPTIHRLNRQYLQHDYPTDVLSFVLDASDDALDGEIIVSAETARAQAAKFGWGAEDELLLYAIHGALHLVGYDDLDPDEAARMRAAEVRYLRRVGLTPPAAESDAARSIEGELRR